MMKTYVVKKGQKPTEEQIREIQEAATHPITFDEDCEKLSPAMLKAFRCVVAQRNRNRKTGTWRHEFMTLEMSIRAITKIY